MIHCVAGDRQPLYIHGRLISRSLQGRTTDLPPPYPPKVVPHNKLTNSILGSYLGDRKRAQPFLPRPEIEPGIPDCRVRVVQLSSFSPHNWGSKVRIPDGTEMAGHVVRPRQNELLYKRHYLEVHASLQSP